MVKYSVIVFDLGNVLVPFNYNPFLIKLNNIEKNLGNNFAKLYADNYEVHRKFESGKITTVKFLNIMQKWTNRNLTQKQFCKLYSDIFSLNNKIASLLPKLKKNYKLVLLSNTNYIHKKYGWEHYKFLKYFDKLILSFEVGANKPDRKIYKAVEKFTGVNSSQHLFIDDVKEYVDGAKKLGWDGIQFENYEQLVKELKNRKVIL